MFSDNAQVSQSPIQRCLYLHAHSELFHEADHDRVVHSFARCFSTKTWLIKPDNVTKSSKMGPHIIQEQ